MSWTVRDTARALLVFLAVIALFGWGYYREAAPPWLLSMTEVLARSASGVLDVLGQGCSVVSRPGDASRPPSYVVIGDGASLDIAIDCNGAWAFAIFVAAVVAMPQCSWRARVWGIGLGVPALWVINTIRVVSLYFVALYLPSVFEEIHLYVWQFLIIAAALGLFMLWAEYFVRPSDA